MPLGLVGEDEIFCGNVFGFFWSVGFVALRAFILTLAIPDVAPS